jgi:hypothetical protein
MSDQWRGESARERGKSMSTSVAAREAFECLNAGTRKEYRGWGDTRTAARDRAAGKAGVTSAQAERLWKHWRNMKSVNGDVYRCLWRAYGHLCQRIETAAAEMEQRAQQIEEHNASLASTSPVGEGVAQVAPGAGNQGEMK